MNTERFDLTLHTATDQTWQFQRVTDTGEPIIPTSARAQIRNRAGGELWLILTAEIDATGVITIGAPRELTSSSIWDRRREGVWDLIIQQGSKRFRILEGTVTISPEVTQWA